MTRIVIADDHTIIRRGLSLILSQADNFIVVAEASSIEELLAALRSDRADLVLLNLSLGQSGIELLRKMRLDFPKRPVLTYNSHSDDMAMKALRAGAAGYIPKETTLDELVVAIGRLAAGGTYVSMNMAEKIAVELARGDDGEKPHERLSRRELEVFRLLGAGRSVGEIAKRLKISVKTVSTHRTRILEKTGLRNNAAIIRYVILKE